MATKDSAAKSAIARKIRIDHEHIALVLQGGGALGAYQAGVYEELAKIPQEPHWVAGISIGAINAALIVGNPPERRVERLREFWDLVSSNITLVAPVIDQQRPAFHQFSSAMAATFGVQGFYRPRLVPPQWQPEGSEAAISVYDTSPLRQTLERLIDFDLINRRHIRLSVGAVNVRSGNSVYFDNWQQRIGPEHIMASGALPPAFPPVEIDGEAYWDGGVVSNTPLQYVLDNRSPGSLLVAQVDLFSARGPMPTTLGAAMARQKDIVYSSRTRFNTDQAAQIQRDRRAIQGLIDRLPEDLRQDPEVRRLASRCRVGHVDIVHLIYRQSPFELESKDYEFSRATVVDHWKAGQRDMQTTVNHPDWLTQSDPDHGVTVYDLSYDVNDPGHHPGHRS
ncbi:MAG: patatin-like phospholipase family protein [Curvibacter sp.]|nr:patatin-like phospholipase family protein [Curvibacter sp.]